MINIIERNVRIKLLILLFFGVTEFVFSQQTKEFRDVKSFYNSKREQLGSAFKAEFVRTTSQTDRDLMKKDLEEFMVKLDSIENVALTTALIMVRNREDKNLYLQKNKEVAQMAIHDLKTKEAKESPASYPGGINELRKEIGGRFYFDAALLDSEKRLSADLFFIVEKDGSVSEVKAIGENFIFNRQAEIALYSVQNKFQPAQLNGVPVRYRFKLPISMNFED